MTPPQEAVEIPAGIKNPFRWIPIGTKVEKVDFTGIQLDILKWHKEQMAKSNEWWNKKLSQELQKAEDREQERIRKTFLNKVANHTGEFFNPWLIDEHLPNTVLEKLLKVIIKKLDESLKKGTNDQ